MLYLKQERLVFVHIPRTGGHSVYELVFGNRHAAYTRGIRKGFSGQQQKLGAHATAAQIRDAMRSRAEWKKSYRFSIVRDPVDRVVSHWRQYRELEEDPISLGKYIDKVLIDGDWYQQRMIPQEAMLTDEGKVIVNRVFNFADGLDPVREMLNDRLRLKRRETPVVDRYTRKGDRARIAMGLEDKIRDLYRDDYARWGEWWR